MTLKPVQLLVYDGSADSKAFHCFMTESTAYMKDGNVPEKKQVFMIAHFLTGKGHTFYAKEVAADPYSWCLHEFFRRLFNFCFPVNYCNLQCDKIAVFMQNQLTVSEYLHELKEMWNTIGEWNDRLKVDKFWKGLRKDFQCDLWKDKLNLEVSTLKEVVAVAEVIEISHSVMSPPRESKLGRCHDSFVVRSAAMTPEETRDTRNRGPHHCHQGQHSGNSNKPGAPGPKTFTPKVKAHASYLKKEVAPRPKLSKDEEAQHKAEGLCFICSGSGHFSRNCPWRNKVVSSSNGNTPPGVTSYGVDLDFGDIECQRGLLKVSASGVHINLMDLFESDNQDEGVDDLPELLSNEYLLTEMETALATLVNASEDGESSESAVSKASEWYLYKYPFCRLPTNFGELLAERARGQLASTCYPGEDPDDPAVYARDHFDVYHVKNDCHVVMDNLYPFEDGLLVASRWLCNPQFSIDRWYWHQIGQMMQIPDKEICQLEQR